MKREYQQPLTSSQQLCNKGCIMGFSQGNGDPTETDNTDPTPGFAAHRLYR